MNGADYIATQRLTDAAGAVVAVEGETCERVPAESLPWLAEQGVIVPTAATGTWTVEATDVEALPYRIVTPRTET